MTASRFEPVAPDSASALPSSAAAVVPRVHILISTDRVGGPGKGLFQLLRLLRGRPLHCSLSVFAPGGRDDLEFVARARELGFDVHLLREDHAFDPMLFVRAWRHHRQAGCNIVQTHGYKPNVMGLFLSRVLGVPWIAVTHGWTDENRRMRAYTALDRWIMKFPDIAVSVSPSLHRFCVQRRGAAADNRLILNAVDVDELRSGEGPAAVRIRHGVPAGALLVGVVGRFSREKGQALAARAFAAVAARVPHARLLFVGEGPERRAVERIVADTGLGERIAFCDYRSDMADYFRAFDLLLLPSLSEGLPNVVLEAMACGTPVLATCVGGVGEIIRDGANGWLIEPDSVAAMAGALQARLERPQDLAPMGERARASLAPKFDPDARAEAFYRVYQHALALGAAGQGR